MKLGYAGDFLMAAFDFEKVEENLISLPEKKQHYFLINKVAKYIVEREFTVDKDYK